MVKRAQRKVWDTDSHAMLQELKLIRSAIEDSRHLYERRLGLFRELRERGVAYADIAEAAGTSTPYVVKAIRSSSGSSVTTVTLTDTHQGGEEDENDAGYV